MVFGTCLTKKEREENKRQTDRHRQTDRQTDKQTRKREGKSWIMLLQHLQGSCSHEESWKLKFYSPGLEKS